MRRRLVFSPGVGGWPSITSGSSTLTIGAGKPVTLFHALFRIDFDGIVNADDSSALAGQPSRQSLRGRGTITSEGMLVSVAPASHPPVMAPRIVYVSQSARAHGEQHMLHARTDQHVAHARTDKHVVHARIDQPVVRTDQHVLHAPTPPTWSSDSTVVVNVALTSPPSSPSPTKQSARLQKRHADGRQQKRR